MDEEPAVRRQLTHPLMLGEQAFVEGGHEIRCGLALGHLNTSITLPKVIPGVQLVELEFITTFAKGPVVDDGLANRLLFQSINCEDG